MIVPAAAAARAVAASPSGCASFCSATGATRTGAETGVPSTVVDVSTFVRRRARAAGASIDRRRRGSRGASSRRPRRRGSTPKPCRRGVRARASRSRMRSAAPSEQLCQFVPVDRQLERRPGRLEVREPSLPDDDPADLRVREDPRGASVAASPRRPRSSIASKTSGRTAGRTDQAAASCASPRNTRRRARTCP